MSKVILAMTSEYINMDGAVMGNLRMDFLIVSEGVQQHQVKDDIRLNIVNPAMLFIAPFLPTQLSFSVVFGITTSDQSMKSQSIQVRIEILDPAGQLLEGYELIINIPDFQKAAAIVNGFDLRNLIIKTEGNYTVNAYINNDLEYAQTFMVYTGDDGNG